MRSVKSLSFQALATVVCLLTCRAATLIEWNTFGNVGTETSAASVSNDSGVEPSTLLKGTGITNTSTNSNRFGGAGWFDTGNSASSTLAEAIAGNSYIEFTITPITNSQISLTSLVFSWERSGTGPSALTLRSSFDNYALDLGTVTGLPASLTTGNTLAISGLSSFTSATTFRLYGYGATATAGTGGFDTTTNATNVQLNGTAVPEPTSALMLLSGVAVLGLSRRRR